MNRLKKVISMMLILIMTSVAVPFNTEAFTIITDEIYNYKYVNDLTDEQINLLNEVSVTDKEMLDDIVERSYNNDFQGKYYIVKTTDAYINQTYWKRYIESRGDFSVVVSFDEFGNVIEDKDGNFYHNIKAVSRVYFSPFNWENWTIERWNEYNDRIKEIEKEIGILDGNLCDYQKIQLAYIWIKQNVKYGNLNHESVSGGQEALEAVLDGYAMCAGYSRIFNRFMHDCGIDSYYVSLSNMSHAHNLVKLEGKYHGVDLQTGTLSYNEGYERYNKNGKLLWLMDGGPFGASGVEIFNEIQAIKHYNDTFENCELSDGINCSINQYPIGTLAEIKQPTCNEKGTFLKEGNVNEYCDFCGKLHEFDLPASHKYKTLEVKRATCTEEGYIKKECTECGYIEKEPLEKCGHDYLISVREATCRNAKTLSVACMVCGNVCVEMHEGEKQEHVMSQWISGRYPGWEYRYCTNQNEPWDDPYTEYKNIETGEITTIEPKTEETTSYPDQPTTEEPDTTEYIETKPPVQTTTKGEEFTTDSESTSASMEETTIKEPVTTRSPQTAPKKLGEVKLNRATRKKASNKIKVAFKKVVGAKKYQVAVYKSKSDAKKNKGYLVRKSFKTTKAVIQSRKLKNRKKLYLRVRAVNGSVYSKWSKIIKVKIRK